MVSPPCVLSTLRNYNGESPLLGQKVQPITRFHCKRYIFPVPFGDGNPFNHYRGFQRFYLFHSLGLRGFARAPPKSRDLYFKPLSGMDFPRLGRCTHLGIYRCAKTNKIDQIAARRPLGCLCRPELGPALFGHPCAPARNLRGSRRGYGTFESHQLTIPLENSLIRNDVQVFQGETH